MTSIEQPKKMKWISIIIIGFVSLLIFILLGGYYIARIQGVTYQDWEKEKRGNISFSKQGVPSIDTENFDALMELQGEMLASERLWQMDLLRRKSLGQLSEIFGDKLIEFDTKKVKEDRKAILEQDYLLLNNEEKAFCKSYAKGVNKFIDEHENRWGLEYLILNVKPRRWKCTDSLAIILTMADSLAAYAEDEYKKYIWQRKLPVHWREFLLNNMHPKNRPITAPVQHRTVMPLKKDRWLKMHPIKSVVQIVESTPPAIGSNSWAYKGSEGAFFANDPHLETSVPGIWYLNRLSWKEKGRSRWVAGASVPGIPGIIIGANENLAWGFTNTGEDVDDYVEEVISNDKKFYQVVDASGKKVWKKLKEKSFSILVKGRKDPIVVTGQFTSRGSLIAKKDGFYSRQFLALKPGYLGLPLKKFMTASNLEQMSESIDQLITPSQNILVIDREGNMMYKPSGREIVRQSEGRIPQKAIIGEWIEIKHRKNKWRKILLKEDRSTNHLATANERAWVSEFGHHWSDDERKDRIRSVLSSNNSFTMKEMKALQLDTVSVFKKKLLKWVLSNLKDSDIDPSLRRKWAQWNGDSRSDSPLFKRVKSMKKEFLNLLLTQLKQTYFPKMVHDSPIRIERANTFLLSVINHPESTKLFGLEPREVARYLYEHAINQGRIYHHFTNRWEGQHVFVKAIPLLGRLFAVPDIPQYGDKWTVNAQQPNHGPSVRMIWDIKNIKNSLWALPVGQSGHAFRSHFKDFQDIWKEEKWVKVWEDS
ncbi:penicillin acylase family protein [Bacteriovoracaceae bacterium]|nr:penicillin acylase family protein [Bacteriovoracaceae bacterium]